MILLAIVIVMNIFIAIFMCLRKISSRDPSMDDREFPQWFLFADVENSNGLNIHQRESNVSVIDLIADEEPNQPGISSVDRDEGIRNNSGEGTSATGLPHEPQLNAFSYPSVNTMGT